MSQRSSALWLTEALNFHIKGARRVSAKRCTAKENPKKMNTIVYLCVYVHNHNCMHTCAHVCVYVCMCVCVCVCGYISTYKRWERVHTWIFSTICILYNLQRVDHLISAVNGVYIVQGRIEKYRVEVGGCFHRARVESQWSWKYNGKVNYWYMR